MPTILRCSHDHEYTPLPSAEQRPVPYPNCAAGPIIRPFWCSNPPKISAGFFRFWLLRGIISHGCHSSQVAGQFFADL